MTDDGPHVGPHDGPHDGPYDPRGEPPRGEPYPPTATAEELREAAQVAAGILAARARDDDAAVRELLTHVADPAARAIGFLVVAELMVTLLAKSLDCTRQDVCARLGVAVAAGMANP